MSIGRKVRLGLLIVVVLAATGGCSKALNYFREKHPDPAPGDFPPQVGKLVIEVNERWGKNPMCTRADPLHCWGYYVLPGGDSEMTRIHYYMQIYDSPEEADARLDEYARQEGLGPNNIFWEDGGPKVGRLLIKNTVHPFEDATLGYCSVSYVRDSSAITIYHGYECAPAREFAKELVELTD